MQLFVRVFNGSSITIETEWEDTILDLKTKIKERYGLKKKFQRLIYNGKHLENHKTIQGSNIEKEANLQLVSYLR